MRYLSALYYAASEVLPAKSDLHHIKNLYDGIKKSGCNLAVLLFRFFVFVSYPISVPLLALALAKNGTRDQKEAAATLERVLTAQKPTTDIAGATIVSGAGVGLPVSE